MHWEPFPSVHLSPAPSPRHAFSRERTSSPLPRSALQARNFGQMAQINEPSFLFLGAGDSPHLPQNHHHRSEAFRKVSGGQQGAGTGHLLTSSFPSPSSFRDQLSAHRPTSAGFCWIPLYPFLVTVPSAGGRESQGAEESPGDQMSYGRCARAVAHSVPKPGKSPQERARSTRTVFTSQWLPHCSLMTLLWAGSAGRSSWLCQGRTKRFTGARIPGAPHLALRLLPAGLGRLHSRHLPSLSLCL